MFKKVTTKTKSTTSADFHDFSFFLLASDSGLLCITFCAIFFKKKLHPNGDIIKDYKHVSCHIIWKFTLCVINTTVMFRIRNIRLFAFVTLLSYVPYMAGNVGVYNTEPMSSNDMKVYHHLVLNYVSICLQFFLKKICIKCGINQKVIGCKQEKTFQICLWTYSKRLHFRIIITPSCIARIG